MIRFSRVTYRYETDGPPALSNIDIEFAAGERVAVAGASGSGKSTLLKLMNGLLLPTSGAVLVDGVDTSDPTRVWEVRRGVGLIFQNPDNQLVSTTVERELAFGMENLGLPSEEIRSRVARVAGDMSLTGLLTRAPHTLSGGEKQRVAIAAVLAMRPDVLALDEPTSLLDGRGRAEVLDLMAGLASDGTRTIVHVTQFPDEIALAPRTVVLHGGTVVFDGRPADLFSRPELDEWGLDRPRGARLADRLRSSGFPVPPEVLSLDELIAAVSEGGVDAH